MDYLKSVKEDGCNLKFIPERFKTEEVCWAAVESQSVALQFVPERYKTNELCKLAVDKYQGAMRYVSADYAKLSVQYKYKLGQEVYSVDSKMWAEKIVKLTVSSVWSEELYGYIIVPGYILAGGRRTFTENKLSESPIVSVKVPKRDISSEEIDKFQCDFLKKLYEVVKDAIYNICFHGNCLTKKGDVDYKKLNTNGYAHLNDVVRAACRELLEPYSKNGAIYMDCYGVNVSTFDASNFFDIYNKTVFGFTFPSVKGINGCTITVKKGKISVKVS